MLWLADWSHKYTIVLGAEVSYPIHLAAAIVSASKCCTILGAFPGGCREYYN